MGADGVVQNRGESFCGGIKVTRALLIKGRRRVRGIPPWTRARCAAAIRQVEKKAMTGRNRKNSFYQGDGFRNAAKEKIRSQCIGREFAGDRAGSENGAKFGSEAESFGSLRVIERLDAQWIARQEEQRNSGEMIAEVEKSKR